MSEQTYLKAYKAAQKEYEELQAKRAEIDSRLARVRQIVLSLARLVGDEQVTDSDLVDSGLTEAVGKVLRVTGASLTPAQIRDELARMGFDIKRFKSIIPSITKVLERLSKKGHVDIGKQRGSKKKFYMWSPLQPQTGFTDISTRFNLIEAPQPLRTSPASHPAYGVTITEPPLPLKSSEAERTPRIDITSESAKKLMRDSLKAPIRPLEMKKKKD
jgi:hypothetical protein